MPTGMRRYPKQGDAQVFSITDFTGGINHMVPPENIQMNEAAFMENFEYDALSGLMKTAPGLTLSFTAAGSITSLFYDSYHGVFLYTVITATTPATVITLYSTDLLTSTTVGTLTGASTPFYCPYGDYVIVSSGNRPQYYDGSSLTTITAVEHGGALPLYSDIAFSRAGRLVLARVGGDYLLYSGVGDHTNWNFTGTDSDAQYIEVGYKDATDIVAAVPLSQDVVVFKSNSKGLHKAYRISDEYPDWTVKEVSVTADCANKGAAVQAANDVFFVGQSNGFVSLSTVQEYGSVKQADVGAKINRQLTGIADENSQVFHIPVRKQIWIVPDNSGSVYVYNLVSGTFTRRKMVSRPTGLVVKDGEVYISRGTKILRIDSLSALDDGSPIVAYYQTRRFVAGENYVIKRVDAIFSNATAALGTVTAGGVAFSFTTSGIGDYIYSDTEDACNDLDDVALYTYQSFTGRGNYRTRYFDVFVTVTSGSVSLRRLDVTVGMVG